MSSEWELTTVGAIAEAVTKGTTPTTLGHAFQASGVNFVKVEAISDDGHFLRDKFVAVSTAAHEALARSQLQSDDVLFTIAGTIGRTAVVSADLLPANTNQAVAIVRPNINKVRPRFLRFVLSNPAFRRLALSRTVESVQANFSLGELKSASILVPSLREQDAIVGILGSIDDCITLLRKTNATLEAIAQALFKSWFVDFDPVRAKREGRAPEGMDEATAALFPDSFEDSQLGEVPRGWVVQRLADAVERITKGTTPTTLKRSFVSSGINFVKAESMTDNGEFLPEKFAFIDEGTHQLLKRSQLAADDVLITIAGTIGRTAVMNADFLPANTNQAVAIIRPKPAAYPAGLLVRFLNRVETKQRLGSHVVQGVQANLSLGTLSELQVVVPEANVVQSLYRTSFGPIDDAKANNSQRIRTLSTLRDTLLPRLISGQLRLPIIESDVAALQ